MTTTQQENIVVVKKVSDNSFTLKSFLVLSLFVCFLIEAIFAEKVPFLSYLDEIVAIVGLGTFVFSRKTKKEKRFLIFLTLFIFFGILGNITAKIVSKGYLFEILVDILSIGKMFFVYFGFIRIFDNVQKKSIADKYIIVIRLFVYAALLCLVLTYAGVLELHDGTRFGLKQYRFIVFNAGNLGYLLMSFLPFLVYRNKKWLIVLTYILIASTLKGPQILFVLFSLSYFLMKRMRMKLNILFLILMALAILFVGQYQIQNYFMDKESARYILIKFGFVDANTHLFGSGFATYASEMSRRIYPSIYFEYGFDKVWGLSQDYPNFLLDVYWPMIIGQFGYIGFAIFLCLFISFFIGIWKKLGGNKLKTIFVLIFICFFIGSFGAAYFIHFLGVLNVLTLAFFVKGDKHEQH